MFPHPDKLAGRERHGDSMTGFLFLAHTECCC